MPNSSNLRRKLRVVLLEQEGFKKVSWSTRRIPCIRRKSRIVAMNTAMNTSGTRNSQGFSRKNVRCSRAARCFRIVKTPLLRQGIRFRWIRKQFVQTWLSIILMTCKHSFVCTMLRYFLRDITLLGQIEQKWVCECSKSFLLALVDTASKKFGQDYSVTNYTCLVDAQGS